MITINKQLIIAESQTIKLKEIFIWNDYNGEGMRARITFDILNEYNKKVDSKVLNYTRDEFNTFWSDFNSGKYLYEELVKKEQLDVVVPETVENDFVNIPVEKVVIQDEINVL